MDPSIPTLSGESGRRLRVTSKADDICRIAFNLESMVPTYEADEVLLKIAAAAINPSDVKALLGLIPQAKWPRTPGRDFSAVVVGGPKELIGLEVWGSSGQLGISCDGTHGTHLIIKSSSLCAKPSTISMLEAGAIGVPFVTAWKGFELAGLPNSGQSVVVLGANGKVGQAAVQISAMLGARTIGVIRTERGPHGYHSAPVEILASSNSDIVGRILELTNDLGADIVFNTVGSPYFEVAHRALAHGGRQILIATIENIVPFNLLEFYRRQHTYVGVDSLSLSTDDSVTIMRTLVPDSKVEF